MAQPTFSQTIRNMPLLKSVDGYCYTRNGKSKDLTTEFWTCELRGKCPGRAITRFIRRVVEETTPHNHLPDPVRMEIRQVRGNMKVAAGNAIGADTTTTIVQAGLMNASAAAKAALPITDHLKRNIQRQRNAAQVPRPLPQDRNDINIPIEFQITGNITNPAAFLLWDSGPTVGNDERILMFGTQRNLDFMATCNSVLMDGTFKTTPPHFAQLYTIHGTRPVPPDDKPSKAVPLLFMLLPDKNESTYRRVFQQVVTFLPQWAPERAMVDFERAAINALQIQWPNLQVTGCFFHLNQNIWKKIQQVGLTRFYGEEVENAIHLKMISALAFVPNVDVLQAWTDLLIILQAWMQPFPQNIKDSLDDLFTYFEVNYIGQMRAGIRRQPRVASIDLWNVRQRTLEYMGRTDNEVEGFHTKVSHTIGIQHPNLWKFLTGLQGLQVESEKAMEELNAGVIVRKQRPEYIRLSERIRNVTMSWQGLPNLETYLRGISYNFQYGGH